MALVAFRGRPAASFPTLISVASGVFGLLAGPAARFPAQLSGEASSLNRRAAATHTPTQRCEGLPVKFFRPSRVPRGRPPLLKVRWPRVTGLTSYPSGYLCFTVGRYGFPLARSRSFSGVCRPGCSPFPVPPFRIPIANRDLPVEVVSPEDTATCWFPVVTAAISGHWVSSPDRNHPSEKPDSDRGWFLRARMCFPGGRYPPHVPLVAQAGTNQPGNVGEICLPPNRSRDPAKGPGYQLSLTFCPFGRYLGVAPRTG